MLEKKKQTVRQKEAISSLLDWPSSWDHNSFLICLSQRETQRFIKTTPEPAQQLMFIIPLHKKKENKPKAISRQKQRFLLHREHGMTVNSQVGTDALGESSVRPHTATTALTKPPKQTESLKNKSKDRYWRLSLGMGEKVYFKPDILRWQNVMWMTI